MTFGLEKSSIKLFGVFKEKKYLCIVLQISICAMSTSKLTREEAIRRWNLAKATKKAMVEKMRSALYDDYKSRTGEEPARFNVL